MKSATHFVAVAALALAVQARGQITPIETANPWSLDVGLNYVTGNFGFEQETDVWLQMTTLHYERDPLHLQLSLPFISITGPAAIIGTVGRPTTGRERGLGDVAFAATYNFTDPSTGISNMDFTARAKLPTADEERGLGTGETDTSLEFSYRRNFGRFTPFASVGYRFLGTSAAYPLEDGLFTTAGVASPLAGRTVGGLAVTWRERIVADADDAAEALLFLSHRLDARWKLQGFALTGFTDASPDFGIGGLVGYKF